MRKLSSLIFILFCGFQAFSQSATFTINVSNDSVLLGNMIAVTFSLENISGDELEFPNFEGFSKVSGPNTSSSMSIMNGEVKQSMSYTFYLEPQNVGDAYIEPASVKTKDGYLETMPYLIKVYPNPDGIIQKPNTMSRQLNMFGDDPFGSDFFNNDSFGNDFFQGGMFENLFSDPRLIQPDTIAPQPKKRKTTRI